jgi:hypothetical protein
MSNGWNVGVGMAGTGIVLPLVETPMGNRAPDPAGHATAFFISATGIFVTAKHVMDGRAYRDALVVVTIWADGVRFNPVIDIASDEHSDIALGVCALEPQPRLRPWVLSREALAPGSRVAAFGFPHNHTAVRGSEADLEMKLRMHPDYHDGEVLDHHPNGVTLVKEPAYSTSIGPQHGMPDLGGVSGGPMISLTTGNVHGMLSTSGAGYSVCCDIRPILERTIEINDCSIRLGDAVRVAPGLFQIV